MKTSVVPDALCSECGATFSHTISLFDDGEVFLDVRVCPGCLGKRADEIKRRDQAALVRSRASVWQDRQMPFPDTKVERLPATRAAHVLYWKPESIGLLVTGPTGMGKSRTMVELLRRLWMEEGCDFAFISWTRYKQQIDRAHRYGGDGVEKLVRPFYRVPVVVIDDLGHGSLNESALGCLFDLLDNRVSRKLPVLITTQFNKEELRDKVSKVSAKTADALIRRLENEFRHVPFDQMKENLLPFGV